MNTRKYPRTLNEAFPHGPSYGCAITRFESDRRGSVIADVLLAVVIGVLLAACLVAWWSS